MPGELFKFNVAFGEIREFCQSFFKLRRLRRDLSQGWLAYRLLAGLDFGLESALDDVFSDLLDAANKQLFKV